MTGGVLQVDYVERASSIINRTSEQGEGDMQTMHSMFTFQGHHVHGIRSRPTRIRQRGFTLVQSSHITLHSGKGLGPFKCYVTPWGWVGVSFPGKSVTKVYGSTLLALRGGGWGSNSLKKSVT